MADGTAIEWTDATWNVVNGCTVHSAGCTNCYAMKQAHRVEARRGLTRKTNGGMVWTGEVRFNEAVLTQPLRWKRPRRIFVCAHGDLFHENVPDEWIDRVFAVMRLAPQHQFQVLTKRSARMRAYLNDQSTDRCDGRGTALIDLWNSVGTPFNERIFEGPWPLPNVWLGVSVEDQRAADERIPDLLATPAAIRWLSCEPLLGPVDLTRVRRFPPGVADREWINAIAGRMWTDQSGHPNPDPAWAYPGRPFVEGRGLDWVVAGGESGPKARPMHPDWARSLRDHCAGAGVPFLFKQWGEWLPWEPDVLPYFKAQTGELMDRHALPDFGNLDQRGWTDDLMYEGDDVVVHQKLGKKATGRLLDGVTHDGFPD